MSSQHPRHSRNSRWGDNQHSSSRTDDRSNTGNLGAAKSAPGVSDQEALQALLHSADAREREREQSSSSSLKRKRPNDSSRGYNNRPDSRGGKREQRLEENKSYYGPTDGDSRGRSDRDSRPRRDEPTGPAKVESDEKDQETEEKPPPPTHKPNFGLSGALAKDSGMAGGNVYKGVVLKFREPPEARTPNTQWRWYVFKSKEHVETLHISKQSAYLIGRNSDICDVPLLHTSLSSQHAVLQYRAVPNKEGRLQCMPYIMDLESTNGTSLNGVRIDPARYYQLKKGDVVTFGASTREYVLMTENTTALR